MNTDPQFPKAAAIREESPYPVELPITRTFLGPFEIGPRFLTTAIWSATCLAHPVGWAVVQMNPRILGETIISTHRLNADAASLNVFVARSAQQSSKEANFEILNGASTSISALRSQPWLI